jgi:hypothetical protein
MSKRDFFAHIYQYLDYVEGLVRVKAGVAAWKNSTIRQKGEQIKGYMTDMK